jgi:hypothetical protein
MKQRKGDKSVQLLLQMARINVHSYAWRTFILPYSKARAGHKAFLHRHASRGVSGGAADLLNDRVLPFFEEHDVQAEHQNHLGASQS